MRGGFGELEKMFMGDDSLTAKKVFDDSIEFYETDNGRRWQQVLKSAGLA